MAAGIMAGVSAGLMKPLLTKLSKLMGDEYKNLKGVRKEVASLNDELTTMNAFLEKMEDADELDPLAKDWKNHVREMAYDMEDCVDDFMFSVHAGDANVTGGIMQKAARRLRKLRARHQIASKIQELKTRLHEASERRLRYRLDECVSSSSNSVSLDTRLTALRKDSANLVGIDGPKQELVKWVMDEEPQLKVLFIIGLGGLGKTTLANQVYLQTGREFKCKAFVSVSQRFDMIGLLNKISSQVGAVRSSCTCEHDLINNLSKYLQHKRYFIVLDDLWDSLPWEIVRSAFVDNILGSRVIITSRNRSVGIASCCPNKYIFDMKPLSHQDSRRLFLTRIFSSEDGCPSNYNKVSDEILKRCGGMPLAIITIASLLAVQKTRLKEEWEYIRNSLSSRFGENPTLEGMKNVLNLSYTHLPRHLKPCFLYFGMYPEDHVISKDQLIKQWVAEGFVSNLRGEAMDIAESYFIDLVNRSLIQPVSIEFNDRVLSCRVHDMMLDLIISKCMEDNFVCLVNYSQTASTGGLHKYKVRRLSTVSGYDEDGTTMPVGFGSLSQVRSAAFFTGSNYMHTARGSRHIPQLSEFKFLRVLLIEVPHYCVFNLTDCFTPGTKLTGPFTPEFNVSDLFTPKTEVTDLTSISQLLHLRYLSVYSRFRGYNSVRLPNRIRGLQQLETLETHGISVESLPTDIVHLPRLSHLSLSFDPRLPLPDGIGNMKSLRTLECFDLVHSSLENISGLAALTNLRHLALSRDNQRDGNPMAAEAMYALFSSIQKLANLKFLNLTNCTGVDDHVVTLLCPSRHMSRHGPGCMLPRVPRWSRDLRNLYSLRIAVDSICTADLHLIGELPSLAKFTMSIAVPAEKIVITRSAGFSNLKRFEFMCDVLSYLSFEEAAMPSLRILSLAFSVPKWNGTTPVGLKQLSSLQEIILQNSGLLYVYTHGGTNVESVFCLAIRTHPNHPKITRSYLVLRSDVNDFLADLDDE